MNQLELSTDSDVIAAEIKQQLEALGLSAWKAGMLLVGQGATVGQISNLLGHMWGIDKTIIENAMKRVKRPCS